MRQKDQEDGKECTRMKIVKDIKSILKLIDNIILSLGITINDIYFDFNITIFDLFTAQAFASLFQHTLDLVSANHL